MIIGHEKQWNFLKKITETKRFSHAYLFSGSDKLGKKTLALEWISLIFGKSVDELTNHPDFIFIEPTFSPKAKDLTGKKEIRIDQLKDLIWRLSLKPSSASRKVAVINDAHLINQDAQACLLKTLEEPRGNALLILISSNPQKLFSTILSRVQVLKFYPVQNKLLEVYLKDNKVGVEQSKEILNIANGSPGVVVDFVSNPESLDFYHEKVKEIEKVINSDLFFRFEYVRDITGDVNILKEILNIWLIHFRQKLIEAVQNKEDVLKLKNRIDSIQKVNFLISNTNVNSKIALDSLMLEI